MDRTITSPLVPKAPLTLALAATSIGFVSTASVVTSLSILASIG